MWWGYPCQGELMKGLLTGSLTGSLTGLAFMNMVGLSMPGGIN